MDIDLVSKEVTEKNKERDLITIECAHLGYLDAVHNIDRNYNYMDIVDEAERLTGIEFSKGDREHFNFHYNLLYNHGLLEVKENCVCYDYKNILLSCRNISDAHVSFITLLKRYPDYQESQDNVKVFVKSE